MIFGKSLDDRRRTIKKFAFFPEKLHSGKYIWLESYYRVLFVEDFPSAHREINPKYRFNYRLFTEQEYNEGRHKKL